MKLSDYLYHTDSAAEIYCGDCLEILPLLPDNSVDLVLTDPPYGINHPTDYRKRGRGKLAQCKDYPQVHNDDKPFDPRPLLKLFYDKPMVLWGGNYFADMLPCHSGWLVWDKERPDDLDQATCELAWTNYVKGVRRLRLMWNGMLRKSTDILCHPTQKPVELINWICSLRWTPDGTILDPYLGSGTTAVAAKQLGRRFIGIEIEER
jgi:DNA modification methylase